MLTRRDWLGVVACFALAVATYLTIAGLVVYPALKDEQEAGFAAAAKERDRLSRELATLRGQVSDVHGDYAAINASILQAQAGLGAIEAQFSGKVGWRKDMAERMGRLETICRGRR